jgi:predicted lysophospholipase L1 biosynthesis ABC-type transport system permease subunit
VIAAGGSSVAPLSGLISAIPFAPAANAPASRLDWGAATFRSVSSGYFDAIGARRIAGRLISENDDGAAPAVAVVNRALADRYFDAGAAVGRELLIDDTNSGPRKLMIVGIVDDLRETDLDGPVNPEVFISLKQVHADGLSLVTATQFWAVRVRSGAASCATTFSHVLREVDPMVATAGSIGLRDFVDAAIAPRRFSVLVLAVFTFIAVLLTTLGVYGITAFVVEQRRREIGVRLALGASPASIVALVVGRTLRVACIGAVVGILGAYAAGGFISRTMFGVSGTSPMLLALVSSGLLATAIVASWLPGRRAAHVDALRALSSE